MDDETRKKIALARYGIIHTLEIQRSKFSTIEELYKYGASMPYETEDGPLHPVSWHTIYRWHRNYKKGGFDALMPSVRSDMGGSRRIDEDLEQTINYYIDQYPEAKCTVLYAKLIADLKISEEDFSLSTLTRFVQKVREKRSISSEDKRRFERYHINEVFYGDTLYGPFIKVNGEKRRVYVLALIDDASRMIVACDAFFQDNTENLFIVMEQAVRKHGVPHMFYFDNGRNYRNIQTQLLAARMGSHIIYGKPYDPTGKAKIERFFRTLREQFLAVIDKEALQDLEHFRQALLLYIQKYNSTPHSSLGGLTPCEKYFTDTTRCRYLDEQAMEDMFLMEEERKVSVDRVIKLHSKEYEVDSCYCGRKMKFWYEPDLSRVFIEDDHGELIPISELDKNTNAYARRIRFSQKNRQENEE